MSDSFFTGLFERFDLIQIPSYALGALHQAARDLTGRDPQVSLCKGFCTHGNSRFMKDALTAALDRVWITT